MASPRSCCYWPHGQGKGCVYQKSDSAVLVVKTAEDRPRYDDSEALNRARERGICSGSDEFATRCNIGAQDFSTPRK
jgi:hypothetical protein